jgi:ribonuclease HI
MKQEKQIKVFYTDGACSGNPGKGGFGVVQLDKNIIKHEYSKFSDLTTNNREELKAILYVMKLAAADPGSEYLVYSDSAYAVNMINDWIWKWAKSDWCNSKNKEVENIDLVKEIYNYLNTDFFNFQIKKCSGHSGEAGNELADALATGNHDKFNKIIKNNDIINI